MSGERPADNAEGAAGRSDAADGALPPQASSYDLRTGQPLPSQRPESDPLPSDTDLGIWAPDYVSPDPSGPWGLGPIGFGESPAAAPTVGAQPPLPPPSPPATSAPTVLPPSSGLPAAAPPVIPDPQPPGGPDGPGRDRLGRLLLAGGAVVLVVMVGVISALLVLKSAGPHTTRQVAHTSPVVPVTTAGPTATTTGPTAAVTSAPTGGTTAGPTGVPVPPSAVPAPAPSPPTRHARVLAASGTSTVAGLAGPSMQRNASGQLLTYQALSTPVTVGSYVDVICTVYGQRVDLGSLGAGNLWDYTAQGWFTDQALQTNTPLPVANACVGNIGNPTSGSAVPSPTSGPFPIYSGGSSVSVQSDHSTSADSVAQLQDGDLVTLVCTAGGDDVSSPNDLTGQPIGHSTQWDKISAPDAGWVPDALVNSASDTSVAPAC